MVLAAAVGRDPTASATTAQPRPPEARLDWHRPLATNLWAAGVSDEHARAVLQFLRAAEPAPGSLDAAEPFTYVAGLLLDDEAAEFRSGFGEISES